MPVVADRGDTMPDTDPDMPADAAVPADAAEPAGSDTEPDEAPAPEPDPFAEIMDITGPVPARGDVAVLALALTPETEHVIDAAALEPMDEEGSDDNGGEA